MKLQPLPIGEIPLPHSNDPGAAVNPDCHGPIPIILEVHGSGSARSPGVEFNQFFHKGHPIVNGGIVIVYTAMAAVAILDIWVIGEAPR
jgi:hypothetical protein